MKKALLCVILLLFGFRTKESGFIQKGFLEKNVQERKEIEKQNKLDSLFWLCIEHLKEVEGFSDILYLDNDGSLTIGYGHHLLPDEYYTKISESKATELLKKDFEKRIRIAEGYGLKENKALAMALFIYNCGEGVFARSKLKRLCMENKEIDNVILRYCHFKHKGKMVRSELLRKRREFELKIYKIKL